MIWLIGLITFIVYRVFIAGMKSKSLFYTTRNEYSYEANQKRLVEKLDGDKIIFYVVWTIGLAFTWPLSIPAIGIYLLGKRYAK